MKIEKVSGSDPDGVILDPDNYEGGINHIEIPHERARHRNGALMAGQTILRSELGKLMRIARIPRPGAIYDSSVAAQTFSVAKNDRYFGKEVDFSGNEEREIHRKSVRMVLSAYRVFQSFCR